MNAPAAHPLSLDEKVRVLSGPEVRPWELATMTVNFNHRLFAGARLRRRGILGVLFTDGPRGVVQGRSTCFPCAMARGATWDPSLEARVGEALGLEARAHGANLFAGVCVNLLRHPAWGRAQETYGEDPWHLGALGGALVRGVERHVMACVKHLACNSMENARFTVDVIADERTLHEVYLPHFKRCVEAGASSVMSAYNKLNGEHCGEHRWLLTDTLKHRWGFEGFVVSDFLLGVRDGVRAVGAGLDLELPFRWRVRGNVARAVRRGALPEARVDDAVARSLRAQRRHPLDGPRPTLSVVASEAHRALAREVCEGSLVLLKNRRGLLPLGDLRGARVALVGPLALKAVLGDHGSSRVRPPYAVTIAEGLARRLGASLAAAPTREPSAVARASREADVTVVVAGYDHHDEGEYLFLTGGDRSSLRLAPRDEAMILAASRANPRTVVVLVGGSAMALEPWVGEVSAVLLAWYPGMEGGEAVARVLLGEAEPGGRLPCVFPRAEGDLGVFEKRARSVRYDGFHGQWRLDRDRREALFPFGYGLSYTTFDCGAAVVAEDVAGRAYEARVTVVNTGSRAGSTVAQLYCGLPDSPVERPRRMLRDFRKVRLTPGESAEVTLRVARDELRWFDAATGSWRDEAGTLELWVGTSAAARDLQRHAVAL
ncbi:MAG: glycoside hydrolase family 3 C-terminal domain-containing protein [Deltaproteobacteria bacterium]|nr:glycoside hydrolase family 3 C-terminal domain-containing protein [Deltaproteobacteria bacterium]